MKGIKEESRFCIKSRAPIPLKEDQGEVELSEHTQQLTSLTAMFRGNTAWGIGLCLCLCWFLSGSSDSRVIPRELLPACLVLPAMPCPAVV